MTTYFTNVIFQTVLNPKPIFISSFPSPLNITLLTVYQYNLFTESQYRFPFLPGIIPSQSVNENEHTKYEHLQDWYIYSKGKNE